MDEICGEQGDKKSAVTAIALQDEKISQEAKECLKSLYKLNTPSNTKDSNEEILGIYNAVEMKVFIRAIQMTY